MSSASDLKPVLDWLAAPLTDDPVKDLAQLVAELGALHHARIDKAHFHRILDLFHDRVRDLSDILQKRLSEARLPLAPELRTIASLLIQAHERIAEDYEQILADRETWLGKRRRGPQRVAQRALQCLAEALETSFMAACPPPAGLWRRTHAVASTAREFSRQSETGHEKSRGIAPADPEWLYKKMLALAAAQPDGFSAFEIHLISDYLENFAAAVNLLETAPNENEEGIFWLDAGSDDGPLPLNRLSPPDPLGVLYCSFQLSARLLHEQIAALEGGMPAGNLRLPESAAAAGGITALKRLHRHWLQPPRRQHPRRHGPFRAEVCIGLNDLWQLLEHGDASPGTPADESCVSEWTVLNESSSGYALMHVAGHVEGLAPGSILALRPARDRPWSICLVRWMRSENDGHLELGLELVSPAARSVQIFYRNGDVDQPPTPGLLLPAIANLRDQPAILALSESTPARRFFIVSGETQTQIAQGRLLSVELQTGSVEMYRFEPDPYPM